MRNTRWLRYGLASIIVAATGLGATLAACGDDGSGSSSGTSGGPETGTQDNYVADTGGGDAADAAPKPNLAKLTIVNASTDLGPGSVLNGRGDSLLRVCFKQGKTAANLSVAPYPPLPDKPKGTATVAGIPYGSGGTFPSFGLDLEDRIIVPIVMNVRTLVQKGIKNPGTGLPGTTCDDLVGDTALKGDAGFGLVEGTDYWVLPQIAANTFKKEKAFVLVLTGCTGDATIANKDKCGPGFSAGGAPAGNLKVSVYETTRTPVSATQLGAQFLHASPQLNAIFGPAGANALLTPGFMSNPADAGTFQAAVAAPVVLNTLTAAQGVTGVNDANYFVLDKSTPGNPGAGPLVPMPLPLIQALSGLGLPAAPTVYVNGKNFVFVIVGEAGQPTFSATDGGGPGDGGDGTVFNTRSPHFIAFPTDPVIEDYKP